MVDLREESIADLRGYACVPSVFASLSIFDVRRSTPGVELVERELGQPVRKDYDSLEDPVGWSRELEAAESAAICAYWQGQRVGGIIIVVARSGLVSWPAVPGAAVLWDLRVAPAHRRQSVATRLLRAAEAWAVQRQCGEVLVETQNTNRAACRFYMHNGFVLREALQGAYPQFPDEVRLIWARKLDS